MVVLFIIAKKLRLFRFVATLITPEKVRVS
jgi:hypothetical protein